MRDDRDFDRLFWSVMSWTFIGLAIFYVVCALAIGLIIKWLFF